MTSPIEVVDLGLMGYEMALDTQHKYHRDVVENRRPSTVLTVEHPTVLTLGKNAHSEHVLVDGRTQEKLGLEIVTTDRGGEVTGHEPGQLVVYPILKMSSFALTPRKFVCLLETSVLELLSSYGIEGRTDEKYPGVWVGSKKVCAIGVRIKERATMHGIALNVANDLRVFEHIVPCGIAGRGVCSMKQLVGDDLDFVNIRHELLNILEKKLGILS